MRFTPPPLPGAVPGELTTYVWTNPGTRRRARLASLGLSLLAGLGVLALVLSAGAALADVRPLVVRSGSMAPALPVGSLALARPAEASQVRLGETVSWVNADGTRVTHRVVASEGHGPDRRLVTRGDANRATDRGAIGGEVDRVVASVPALGGWLAVMGSTTWLFAVGLLSGAALLWSFGPAGSGIGRWVPEAAAANGTRR